MPCSRTRSVWSPDFSRSSRCAGAERRAVVDGESTGKFQVEFKKGAFPPS